MAALRCSLLMAQHSMGQTPHGIFRLTSGSDSWEELASMQPMYVPSAYITSLAFDGTMFYAGTEAEGVFRLSLEE